MKMRLIHYIGALFLTVLYTAQLIANPTPVDTPSDVTVAFFRIEGGTEAIYAGKLHSGHFRKLGIGDYPSVSPNGKFVAYNPEGDARFTWRGIPPVIVKEIATGKETHFNSIPKDTAPWPSSIWSTDNKLITFNVHDFRDKAVVSMVDGSFWQGTEQEFNSRYASLFPIATSRVSIEIIKDEANYYGWPPNAVFYQSSGGAVRVTPKDMWIADMGAVWIEKTGEVLFAGVWHSKLKTTGPIEKRAHPTPTIYLIKPQSKDWANASKEEWDASAIFEAIQAACNE